jgi:uncharacterized membrane protein (DUF485 family)
MRNILVGAYSYGVIRMYKKKYMNNKVIPLNIRVSLSIQPIIITPIMLPIYIAEDNGLL